MGVQDCKSTVNESSAESLVLLAEASNKDSCNPAQMASLARAFAAGIHKLWNTIKPVSNGHSQKD